MDKLKSNIGVIMVILGLIGSTGTFYSKFAKMEATINQLSSQKKVDTSGLERQQVILVERYENIQESINTNMFSINDSNNNIATLIQQSKVLEVEVNLLKNQIKELKELSDNPLAN